MSELLVKVKLPVTGQSVAYEIIDKLRARDKPDEDELEYQFAGTAYGLYFAYPILGSEQRPTMGQLDEFYRQVMKSKPRQKPWLSEKRRIRHIKSGDLYTVLGWVWSMLHQEWLVLYQGDKEKDGFRFYMAEPERIERKFEVV